MDCVVQNLKLSNAHPLEWASLQDHSSVQNSDLLLSEIISLVKVCKVATGPQNFVPESSDSLWALFCKIRSDDGTLVQSREQACISAREWINCNKGFINGEHSTMHKDLQKMTVQTSGQ